MCLYTSAMNNVKNNTKNTIQLISEPKTIIYIGSVTSVTWMLKTTKYCWRNESILTKWKNISAHVFKISRLTIIKRAILHQSIPQTQYNPDQNTYQWFCRNRKADSLLNAMCKGPQTKTKQSWKRKEGLILPI